MAGIRQTFDSDGKPHPKWKFWYKDWQGKRVFKTGTADPERTLALAESFEAKEDRIRRDIELGISLPPTSAELAKPKPIGEIIDEYQAWGRAQGGKGGRPWSSVHARMTETQLKFWLARLGLKTISDLYGLLPRVERELRELVCVPRKTKDDTKKPKAPTPASGKTKENYAGAITAFCAYAKRRGYISSNPMDERVPFDITAKTQRRAMTAEDVQKLLEAAAPHRRLLYEVAFCTGLRVNELRQLTPAHIDVERSGLRLDAAWTKARKSGLQRLPAELLVRLQKAAQSGQAKALYAEFSRTSERKDVPSDPLLYVPSHPARDMEKDLIAAGLAKWGPEGKADFHACRAAYTTFIEESGAHDKELQEMARHSNARITFKRYVKAHDSRLRELTEAVGSKVLVRSACATSVQQKAVGAEGDFIPNDINGLSDLNWSGRRDLNPRPLAPQASALIQAAPRPDDWMEIQVCCRHPVENA